jgi:signal transduction histidine kinase
MVRLQGHSRAVAALALCAAGAGASGLTVIAVAASQVLSHPSANAAARGVAVALFVAVGAHTWWRRPDSGLGLLIAGIGLSFALTSLMAFERPLPFALGRVALAGFILFTAYVFACFPRDHLAPGPERRLIRAFALTTVVLWALMLGLGDELPVGGPVARCVGPCPRNALQLAHPPDVVSDALALTVSGFTALSLAAVTVLLVVKSRSPNRLRRRAVEPLLCIMAVAALAYGIYIGLRQLGVSDAAAPGAIAVAMFLSLPIGIVAGQIRGRMFVATRLARLAAAAGDAGVTHPGLQALLVDALGDPTLRLAIWSHERAAYVDAQGVPMPVPAGAGAISVNRGGLAMAAVIHDPDLDQPPGVSEGIAATVALLLENSRLVEALKASRTRVAHATHLERVRLERDLHDGAQQRITAIQIKLSLVRDLQVAHERNAALDDLAEDAAAAVEELRSLATGIYPALLGERGLGDALSAVAANVPGSVVVRRTGTARYGAATEAAVYFAAVEAMQNAMKHTPPGGHLELSLECADAWVSFTVVDDGEGFDVDQQSAGLGLQNMRDRMESVGGVLSVASVPGRGTTVSGRAPAAHGATMTR